uniref:Uncharacterized protein n=1 Tax=Lepeophtheirus salmonis TaxID=72036 RepID=A0A0K2VHG8_LEPSM
MNTASSVNQKV